MKSFLVLFFSQSNKQIESVAKKQAGDAQKKQQSRTKVVCMGHFSFSKPKLLLFPYNKKKLKCVLNKQRQRTFFFSLVFQKVQNKTMFSQTKSFGVERKSWQLCLLSTKQKQRALPFFSSFGRFVFFGQHLLLCCSTFECDGTKTKEVNIVSFFFQKLSTIRFFVAFVQGEEHQKKTSKWSFFVVFFCKGLKQHKQRKKANCLVFQNRINSQQKKKSEISKWEQRTFWILVFLPFSARQLTLPP